MGQEGQEGGLGRVGKGSGGLGREQGGWEGASSAAAAGDAEDLPCFSYPTTFHKQSSSSAEHPSNAAQGPLTATQDH